MEGQSIKEYVMKRLLPPDQPDKKSWQEFKQVMLSRIAAAKDGEISDITADQIIAEELGS